MFSCNGISRFIIRVAITESLISVTQLKVSRILCNVYNLGCRAVPGVSFPIATDYRWFGGYARGGCVSALSPWGYTSESPQLGSFPAAISHSSPFTMRILKILRTSDPCECVSEGAK